MFLFSQKYLRVSCYKFCRALQSFRGGWTGRHRGNMCHMAVSRTTCPLVQPRPNETADVEQQLIPPGPNDVLERIPWVIIGQPHKGGQMRNLSEPVYMSKNGSYLKWIRSTFGRNRPCVNTQFRRFDPFPVREPPYFWIALKSFPFQFWADLLLYV